MSLTADVSATRIVSPEATKTSTFKERESSGSTIVQHDGLNLSVHLQSTVL
jgi:hypothetical protein